MGAVQQMLLAGKGRSTINIAIAANTSNYTLTASAQGGYVAGQTDINLTVNAGIYVWSSAIGTPAMTLTGFAAGDTLNIVNLGFIMGCGGKGGGSTGTTAYGAPTAGGNAISLGITATIDNTNASAYIGGGGGGGGGSVLTVISTTVYAAGGGAGGGDGGQWYQTGIIPIGTGAGGAGGAIGVTGGAGASNQAPYGSGGGGGGRIFSGTGGASTTSPTLGSGGGSGGGGGSAGGASGAGGSGSAAGGSATGVGSAGGGGGGGGWGASGGAGGSGGSGAGAAGGKAVALNGNGITWVSGNTTRVYGVVS